MIKKFRKKLFQKLAKAVLNKKIIYKFKRKKIKRLLLMINFYKKIFMRETNYSKAKN